LIITLKFEDILKATARATIIKTFKPFTCSCVMLVELAITGFPEMPENSFGLPVKGQYVLKIYDRRFAAEIREDPEFGNRNWIPDIEKEYNKFVSDGCAQELFHGPCKADLDCRGLSKDEEREGRTGRYLRQRLLCSSYVFISSKVR
jgi:hypothetical protein